MKNFRIKRANLKKDAKPLGFRFGTVKEKNQLGEGDLQPSPKIFTFAYLKNQLHVIETENAPDGENHKECQT